LNAGPYLVGIVFLVTTLSSIAVASRRVRQWLLPDWTLPESGLVDAVIFLALLLGICALLGTVGLFRFWFILVVSALTPLAARVLVRTCRTPSREVSALDREDREVRRDPFALAIGIIVAAVVIGMWVLHTQGSMRGIRGYDSLNYHLPFAARFLQHGHTLPLTYAKPGDETAFDPLNAELLIAFAMVPFHRDVLVPFLSIGWAAFALLASWCIGHPRGIPELTLASASIIFVTPLMMHENAGQATNDIVAIALLLAAVALLVRAEGHLPAIAVAGAAAGLSLGTKLTIVVPLLVMTIGYILIARRGRRLRTALAWLVPIFITGGYWYARNLIAVGNPVPALHLGIGSWSLPSPRLSNIDRFGFTIAHYATNSRVIHRYFLPGLGKSLGHLWPLTLALTSAGMVLGSLARDRLLAVFGATAIGAFGAYIITPTSAAGRPGDPNLFFYNIRFAYPALVLGLLLVPLSCAPRVTMRWRRLLLLVVLAALAAEQWPNMALTLAAAMCAGVGFGVAAARIPRPHHLPFARRAVPVLAAVTAIGCIFTGYFVQQRYLQRRYAHSSWAPDQNRLFAWARTISHARIADAEERSYPLDGVDLSNYVERIGVHGHAGSFELATNCVDWRTEIARGNYKYIVSSVGREESWTRGPSVHEVFRGRTLAVFEVLSPFDPNACPNARATVASRPATRPGPVRKTYPSIAYPGPTRH
jgi:hypothetical protein